MDNLPCLMHSLSLSMTENSIYGTMTCVYRRLQGHSLESDVPRADNVVEMAARSLGATNLGFGGPDKQTNANGCADGNGPVSMQPQGLVLQPNYGMVHGAHGGCRVEHSPSLSKDSGIHLNSNSTEETTSSKSGSEDGNNSFNPRRSRALQRNSRRHLR